MRFRAILIDGTRSSSASDKIGRMTLAQTERSDNVARALKSMLDRVADAALDEVSFSPTAHPEVLTTTWDELLAAELIERLPSGEYILTGRGWTGRINDRGFEQRIEKLFGTLKGFVKGRRDSATVPLSELVTQTGLPEGFVFNIIEGKYMEELSKRRGASWVKPGRLVLIPVAFGIQPTDLRTLLDPAVVKKMEELEDELGTTRGDLSRYRCPHCNAEMTASGGYRIDEHNDGDYEQFSCGYGQRDGQVDSLCPKDPHFPKFEDFELVTNQREPGEWICRPKPKTPYAQLIGLDPCSGRTKEEAERRVKARYLHRSGQKRNITDRW
jgi:hypothetical protein